MKGRHGETPIEEGAFPPPIGISGDEQKLFIKLETEYREAVGLARVEATLLETDRGFCLISCFQAGRSFRDNLRAFMQMPKEMQTLTGRPELGGFWLIAHWVEAAGTVEGTDQIAVCWRHCLDYSWLFVQPPRFEDRRWLTAATLMAQAHGQDFSCCGRRVLKLRGSTMHVESTDDRSMKLTPPCRRQNL